MKIFDLRNGKTWDFPKTCGGACSNSKVGSGVTRFLRPSNDIVDKNLTPQQMLTRINAQIRSKSLHFLARRHREFAGSKSASQLQRFVNMHWDYMQAIGLTWKPSPCTLHRALTAADVEHATRRVSWLHRGEPSRPRPGEFFTFKSR